MSIAILSQATDIFNNVANLGAAGLMGAMWLWERRTSRQREQQLDETHDRILADKVALEELMSVVRQNADALARLTVTQERLLQELGRKAA
jgi:glutamine synthetase type III